MTTFKSVDEQILALKRSKRKIVEQLKTLNGLRIEKTVKKSDDMSDEDPAEDTGSGTDWSTDQEECWKQMMDSIDDHDARIGRLESIKSLEKGDEVEEPEDNATMSYNPEFRGEPRFKTANKSAPHIYAEARRSNTYDEPGFAMVRFMLAQPILRQMGREAAHNFVEQRFNDSRVTRALASLTQGAGGALVPQDFYMEIIELLRSETVVRSSNPIVIAGPNGNLTIPRLAGAATASYGVELSAAPVTQQTFDNLQLAAKKLTAVVPISNSLIRRAAFGIEQIVRDDMIQSVARTEDLAFLTGTGASNTPTGFSSLVTSANTLTFGTVPQTGGYQPALAQLLSAIGTLRLGASRMIRPVWICSPVVKYFLAGLTDSVGNAPFKEELMKNPSSLLGYPLKDSIQLGVASFQTTIFLVDMADVIIMDSYTPEVDMSVDATWITGGTTFSAFQNDVSLARIVLEHDFNMRHLQSLVMINANGWVPGYYTGSNSTTYANVVGTAYTTQTLNNSASAAPSATPTTSSGA